MGRPALAFAVAEATGAMKRNPERYKESAALESFPLGPPGPEIMRLGLIEQWRFFTQSIHWLTEADRRLVEIACVYRANFWKMAVHRSPIIDDQLIIPPGNTDDLTLYSVDHRATAIDLRIMEKLGGTPTSRPKVTPANGGNSTKSPAGKRKNDGWW